MQLSREDSTSLHFTTTLKARPFPVALLKVVLRRALDLRFPECPIVREQYQGWLEELFAPVPGSERGM